jgi:hypothetical protein
MAAIGGVRAVDPAAPPVGCGVTVAAAVSCGWCRRDRTFGIAAVAVFATWAPTVTPPAFGETSFIHASRGRVEE